MFSACIIAALSGLDVQRVPVCHIKFSDFPTVCLLLICAQCCFYVLTILFGYLLCDIAFSLYVFLQLSA